MCIVSVLGLAVQQIRKVDIHNLSEGMRRCKGELYIHVDNIVVVVVHSASWWSHHRRLCCNVLIVG